MKIYNFEQQKKKLESGCFWFDSVSDIESTFSHALPFHSYVWSY